MARHKHPPVILTKLGRQKADGINDWTNIYIDERLKGKRKLDVYIHEYMHYLFPDMNEKNIRSSATRLTDFLWKHHTRMVDNVKE